MRYIYKLFLFGCLLIVCNVGFSFSDGSTSDVDVDTDGSIRALLDNIRIATNQQDITLLFSYLTDDFVISIQSCGRPAKELDKEGFNKFLEYGYGALSEYVKQTKVKSIHEIKKGYLARSSTIEISTLRANNQNLTTNANESVYMVESDGLLKANKIDSIEVCR